MYEKLVEQKLFPMIPICARLDGKAFHSFTKGLQKPYDTDFIDIMTETTKKLVDMTNASIGYTQSDEISLIWLQKNTRQEIFMGGKRSKMISVIASATTAIFNSLISSYLPQKSGIQALFDCRVWNVINKEEAANYLLWREQDATRNSIQSAGQSVFSHKQLMNKSCDDIQEMLFSEKGINWNDYPSDFKRGTYIQRRCIRKWFTTEELNKLPPLHNAHKNPDLLIERHEIRYLDMPKFSSVTNKTDVIFEGFNPEQIEENNG